MTNNNSLKGVIAGVYILLILLLMLNNCHGCSNDAPTEPTIITVVDEPVDDPTSEERASNIGGDGEIKITALWDFPGDVDLHLTQPNGNEIWFRNMKDRSTNAELDVDDINGGPGSAENIKVETPLRGQYLVELVMYHISDDAPNGGQVKVVIKNRDHTQTIPVQLSYTNQRVRVASFAY